VIALHKIAVFSFVNYFALAGFASRRLDCQYHRWHFVKQHTLLVPDLGK